MAVLKIRKGLWENLTPIAKTAYESKYTIDFVVEEVVKEK